MIKEIVFPALWLAVAAYWVLSAAKVKSNEKQEPFASRLAHIGPLILAGILVGVRRTSIPVLDFQLYPRSSVLFWLGAAVTALGFGFGVAARREIGRNWSGTVTIKADHELVTAGPYSVTRHPIYTGLLTGFLGTALAVGEVRGVLAILIAWAALQRKLSLEERWMAEQFGEAYAAYRRKVPALIPLLK